MAGQEREQGGRQAIPEATSRGILSDGSLVADYYTAEPSPGKWVAVGMVMFWPVRHDGGFPRWMLVGAGRSEQQAVTNLRDRMKDTHPPRWKIRCEPISAPIRRYQEETAKTIAGRFVVPWEIGTDDVGVLMDAAASDASLC